MVQTGFLPETENPKYPCDTDRPRIVGEYLATRNFLESDERVQRLTPPPMVGRNAMWRVETTARSFMVKQFRPWPANGRAAPTADERFRAECQFYRTVRIANGTTQALPAVLHSDCRVGCLIFEDVAAMETQTPLQLSVADAQALGWFLVGLHHRTQSVPVAARYESPEVVGWQMAHLFQPDRSRRRGAEGRWLARFIAASEKTRDAVEDARAALAKGGSSLVHGDFTAANWLRTREGSLRVIDAEFSFFGPPEFDAGAFIASLLFLRCSREILQAAVEVVAKGCFRYHTRLTAALTGVHLCHLIETSRLPGHAGLRGSAASAALRRIRQAVETDSLERSCPARLVEVCLE